MPTSRLQIAVARGACGGLHRTRRPQASNTASNAAEIGVEYRPDRAGARRDIENWIRNYNQRRLHSSLDYRTPIETRHTWQERMATAA